MIFISRIIISLVLGLGAVWAKQVASPVNVGAEGKLIYASTEQGDRVPDFSSAGYAGRGRGVAAGTGAGGGWSGVGGCGAMGASGD